MMRSKIVFFILMCCGANATAYDEALTAVATAAFKQSGGEEIANRLIKEYVPKEVKEKAEKIIPAVVAISNGRLEWKWTF